MSRTIRQIRRGYKPQYIKEGGDAQVNYGIVPHRKMTPYTKEGLHNFKFKASKTSHIGGFSKGLSKYDKLVTKNANRSLKKGIRQKLKKQLKNELEGLSSCGC